MIYELLEHLKSRIESTTQFRAMVLPTLPAVYTLNTAYIIIPDNVSMQFGISSDIFSDFSIDIYFVVSDCNADDMATMSKNVMKAYGSVKALINDILPRGGRSYSDSDMDANCHDINVSAKTWMTGGKIPISVDMSTQWRAILKG